MSTKWQQLGDTIVQPGPKEEYSDFYKRAPKPVKDKLKKLKERAKKYSKTSKKEQIIAEIDTDKLHHQLVKSCAQAFAQTELAEKSGYEFYFAEPLIELGSESQGNNSFDLLLYNENENRALFIECKSSLIKGKKALNEVESSKKLILQNLDYLSQIIGVELDSNKCEYVLAVYDKDSNKVTASLNGQNEKKTELGNSIILWVYKPHSDIVQLYPDHKHHNNQLNNLLENGFGNEQLKNKYDLPFCYSTHLFRLISLVIVSECYNKNLYSKKSDDPKVISVEQIKKIFEKKVSLGAPKKKIGEMVENRVEKMLNHGIKYDLFIRSPDKKTIRLQCRGEKVDVVLDNIWNKYCENWIEEKSERDSEIKAMDDYREEIKKSGVQRYLTEY